MLGSAYIIPGLAFPKQNFTEAYSWFEKAAQAGRRAALNTAGMMKLYGLGTKQDGIQAVEWITRASELGNASAHFNLGIIRVFFPKELKAPPQLPFHKRRKLLRRVFYWVEAFCTENRIRTMKEADTPN